MDLEFTVVVHCLEVQHQVQFQKCVSFVGQQCAYSKVLEMSILMLWEVAIQKINREYRELVRATVEFSLSM